MSMSQVEATTFLREVINMSTDSGEIALPFLNAIIWHFQHMIPFQSVTACAIPPKQRHLPPWEEIKADIFSKHGGLCYHLNVFMKVLLESLGYNVHFASADIVKINDHVTVIVSHLNGEGSYHLVEVGCGYPTFQAIPLNFDKESPEYLSGFLRHKFVRKRESIIWYHEPRRSYRPIKDTDLVDGWYRYAEIKPFAPCDISSFESTMTSTYTDPYWSNFLQMPRAVIFEKEKLVAIKGNQYITQGTDRNVDKAEVHTLNGLLEKYQDHFPQLETEMIKDAISNTDMKF